jgi:hypothetical protein
MGPFAECGRVPVKPLRSDLASSISGCSGFTRVASWKDARSVRTEVKPAFFPLRPKTGWPEVTNCPATSTNLSQFACWTHLRSDPVLGKGWCLGGEEFRQELLEQVDARPGPSHFGEAVQEAEAAQAERLVVERLKRLRWSEADLRARGKGERGKVQLARELRSKTTMPLAWIASPLNMGSRGHLAWLLQQHGSGRLAAPTDQCLLEL